MARPWSEHDIPDLTGKAAVVTGATSGIGFETARALAHNGATTIVAARNSDKAAAAVERIRAPSPAAVVSARTLDVTDLTSVRDLADGTADEHSSIDLLVNNAGIMMVPYGTTVDGNELQFGTNHLGHFALTGLLMPMLERSGSARVITVSSLAHRAADIDFDDLQFAGGAGYEPFRAYRRSKLANLLFAYELDRRLRAAGSRVESLAAHPGLSNTNLGNESTTRWWWRVLRPAAGSLIQSPANGALPTLRAATDPDASGRQYYGPAGRGERGGPPVLVESSELSHDPAIAARLWEESERLTGVRYLR